MGQISVHRIVRIAPGANNMTEYRESYEDKTGWMEETEHWCGGWPAIFDMSLTTPSKAIILCRDDETKALVFRLLREHQSGSAGHADRLE